MFLLAFLLFIGVVPDTEAVEPVRVLIIASYNELDPCGAEQIRGIRTKFNEIYGENAVEIRVLYMRGRKINVTPESRKKVAWEFFDAFKRFKPNVVFLVDDIAIEYMTGFLLSDSSDYIVVFSGMNRSLLEYQKEFGFMERIERNYAVPKKNVTGVVEKIHVKVSLRFAEKLLKPQKGDTVVFLLGKDDVSKLVLNQIKAELGQSENIFPFDDIYCKLLEVGTFDELIQKLDYINSNPRIPFYYPLTLRVDSAGKFLDMKDLAPYYLKIVRKPDVVLNKFFCNMGFLGGVSLDFQAMGEKAASKAIDYLRGQKDIRKIHVEEAMDVITVFNISRIRDLNFRIPFNFIINSEFVSK